MSAFAEEKGSRRPDGTYRKPVRIREGYVNPDEVGKYAPPMTKNEVSRPAIPGLVVGAARAAAPVKVKKTLVPASCSSSSSKPSPCATSNATKESAKPATVAVEVDEEKRLRGLEKKMREISLLDELVAKGEQLNDDQQQKHSKKKGLLEQIAECRSKLAGSSGGSVEEESSSSSSSSSSASQQCATAGSAATIVGPTDSAKDASSSAAAAAAAAAVPVDVKEVQRKVKAVQKKLRQIEEIETKAGSDGAKVALNEDQREKLAKKAELEAELRVLQEQAAAAEGTA